MSAPKLTAEELDEVGASFSAGCSEAAELKNEYMARICLHSLRLHAEHAALNAEVAALRNCGQDGVCATPPGCLRHWEERNRELAAELRGQITAECHLECVLEEIQDAKARGELDRKRRGRK
jgi:hypothetical protein